MAYIEFNKSKEVCFLHSKHIFGRKNKVANTSFNVDLISRNHASIEWDSSKWLIQDFSRNGTWINDIEIASNTLVELNVGDVVCFGSDEINDASFTVKDLSKPQSLIYRPHPSLQFVPIEDSNLIPDKASADFGLYYCYTREGWYSQTFNTDNDSTDNYENGPHGYDDEIMYAGNRWKLFLLDQDPASSPEPRKPITFIDDIEFQIRFNKTQDDVRVNLITQDDEFELEPQSYTKLLANLISLQQHSEDSWVPYKDLAKSMDNGQASINLKLFMFRHHLASSLNSCKGVTKVIERNSESLRLGISNYSIYRDGKLDQSSVYDF